VRHCTWRHGFQSNSLANYRDNIHAKGGGRRSKRGPPGPLNLALCSLLAPSDESQQGSPARLKAVTKQLDAHEGSNREQCGHALEIGSDGVATPPSQVRPEFLLSLCVLGVFIPARANAISRSFSSADRHMLGYATTTLAVDEAGFRTVFRGRQC